MKHINSYPTFTKGQVLTSDSLNKAFGYIDQQSRLKAQFVGNGILEGLEFENKGQNVTIKQGTALTSDGFLIKLEEDQTYSVAVAMENTSCFTKSPLYEDEKEKTDSYANHAQYVLFKNSSEALQHGVSAANKNGAIPKLKDFILALAVDFVPVNEKIKCTQYSCNLVQTDYQVEIRPILYEITRIGFDGRLFNEQKQIATQYTQKRLVNFANATNVKLLNKKTSEHFHSIRKSLLPSVAKILEALKSATLPLESLNPMISRFDCLYKHLQSFGTRMTEIPEYYILHLEDIGVAINEFVSYYNEFAHKYPILPSSNAPHNGIVILGSVNSTFHIPFRQQYHPIATDNNLETEKAILNKLLYRILLLSENFIGGAYQSFWKKDCVVIWKQQNAKLGDSAVPYYYKTNQEILKYWNPFQQSNISPARFYNSADTTPIANGIMMINGHYCRDLTKTESQLQQYITNNDLPITIKTIKLHHKKLSLRYKNIITKRFVDKEKLKNINNIKTILESANKTNPINLNDMKFAAKTIGEFIDTEFPSKKYYIHKSDTSDLLAISALHSYLALGHDESCKNAITIGGCPYNGDLVLFHHNRHVLLCLGVTKS